MNQTLITESSLILLRVALAASMKYFPHDTSGSWKKVLHGGRLKSINSMAGDAFAFWYKELGFNPYFYDDFKVYFFDE